MLRFPGLDKQILRKENEAQLPFCLRKKIALQIMFVLSLYGSSLAISVKHKKSCFANKRYHPAPFRTKQALHHAEGTGKGHLSFWPVQHWLCIIAQWAKLLSGKWVCGAFQGGVALHHLDVVPCALECMSGMHSHLFERLSSSHPPKPLSHYKTWHTVTFALKVSSWSTLSCSRRHRQFRGPSLSIYLAQQRHS